MPTNLEKNIKMDFTALSQLQNQMNDAGYIEYIWNKLFDNKNAVFEKLENHTTWQYPECWRARYWLNYIKHGKLLKDKKILEIGSNMHFYSVWSVLCGASSVHGIEPNQERFDLGKEYLKIRNMQDKISSTNISIENYMANYDGEKYDIVFFQDVLYYLFNPIEVLHFMSKVIKPKILFLETTVTDDFDDTGHFSLYQPSSENEKMQVWKKEIMMALLPSRNALKNIINNLNCNVISYYNYQDFIGHGESPPRKRGQKDFYVLELTNE